MRDSEHIRLLLPVEPEDDCRDALHLIDSIAPRAAVDLLRVYAYRPAEMDVYSPEMLFSIPAAPRLDAREKSVVDELTRTSCRAIADAFSTTPRRTGGGVQSGRVGFWQTNNRLNTEKSR